jgi:hypothetical protein
MLEIAVVAAAGVIIAVVSFRAGRTVGWYARGYVEEARTRDMQEKARLQTFKEVEGMIAEELASRASA